MSTMHDYMVTGGPQPHPANLRGNMPTNKGVLDRLFVKARTHHAFVDSPVDDATLKKVYDVMKWGPTSYNTCPARFVFVRTSEAKERLLSCLDKGNIAQTRAAPVTVIMAYDLEFYEKMAQLAPHSAGARDYFAGHQKLIETTAFRNGTLQGAYFMIAARAFGLDCGPMSGFDNEKLDKLFFAGTSWRSNFLCNIGHGDIRKLRPRDPRLSVDESCQFV